MKALVIGAGMIGSALAYDFATSQDVTDVIVADIDGDRSRTVAEKAGPNVRGVRLDSGSSDEVVALMRGVDVAVGATSYSHNYRLTEAAIEARIHFCDLGGNMDVVHRQMTLDSRAKAAGITVLPNCGLAPGLGCIIGAGAATRFDRVDSIQIRVGGLPQHPKPPLNYQLVFSAEGLVNEYIEPAEVLRDGKRQSVNSMEDLEELGFPPPFGTMEAFNTSGGVSTLPSMFEGRVRTLDYKTIRYPGHCEKFRALLELGFASPDPISVGNRLITSREVFENLLRKRLASDSPDVVLMRVTITGEMAGKTRTLAYEMIDYYDTRLQMTSMARTTAFPTSIAAQMLVRGEVTAKGVFPPEQSIPLVPLLGELKKRNIVINESLS
jgi:lysine 6-dehydrogenase